MTERHRTFEDEEDYEKELKTLKDLEKSNDEDYDDYVHIEELKAEAVKWAKQYIQGQIDCDNIKQYEEAEKCQAILGFIINFFNLTEEELKETK